MLLVRPTVLPHPHLTILLMMCRRVQVKWLSCCCSGGTSSMVHIIQWNAEFSRAHEYWPDHIRLRFILIWQYNNKLPSPAAPGKKKNKTISSPIWFSLIFNAFPTSTLFILILIGRGQWLSARVVSYISPSTSCVFVSDSDCDAV